ncbi:MAG: EamA family transporter [Firmicutes bacterium]|nr:EamA family transporter [Bacillota bacterium]
MFVYIWPMALIVLSNVCYHICTKGVPGNINPFASLTITYLIGTIACAIMFFLLGDGGSLIKEYSKLNCAPIMLGLAVSGLEVGWIFAYKAGWPVNTGFIMQSAIVASILILVGFCLYHEAITWNKVVGVVVCLIGLVFINLK